VIRVGWLPASTSGWPIPALEKQCISVSRQPRFAAGGEDREPARGKALAMQSRSEGETPETAALRRFVAAVYAVSTDPCPGNVRRYLEASRRIEEARRRARAATAA
jgi:hypothetical protein